MNRLIVAFFTATLVAVALADANDMATAKRPRRPSRPNGGLLERREAIPSKQIGIANMQTTLAEAQVAVAVGRARIVTNVPLVVGKGNSPAKIELVDRDDKTTITISPEDFKAVINVKALAADGAKAEVVEARVRKELVRASFFLLGSGSTRYDVTQPIFSLKELDGIDEANVSAETIMHMGCKNKAGVKMLRFSTYRMACQEGWAPAPTNDIQKAIWDKVHAMPTAPLKIKPETKKVAD